MKVIETARNESDITLLERTEFAVAGRRILPAGLLAAALSLGANLLVRAIGLRFFGVSPEFAPFGIQPQLVLTIAGCAGATTVFALVSRFSAEPLKVFQGIAGSVLALSFVPDLALLLMGSAGAVPGYSVVAIGLLMVEHLLTGIICVYLLTRLTRVPVREA